MRGRPLRFLAMTLTGWTAMRVAMLWPAAPSAALPRHGGDPPPLVLLYPGTPVFSFTVPGPVHHVPGDGAMAATAWPALPGPSLPRPADPAAVALAITSLVRFGPAAPVGTATRATPPRAGALPPPLIPTPLPASGPRLAGSAWLLARGGASGTLSGGQLGASQAGVRVLYAVDSARRLALAARLSTPLQGKGRELGVGLDWRPTKAPVHLIAEQRIALDGGRGGPTVMAVGGVGPVDIAPGFRLEAYAEAGAIARDGVEAFGDGAARITRPLGRLGPARLDLGAGAWGAGQRGAQRLDLGPTIGAVLPIGRRALRLTLDWRERVAGTARPASGPALSIGGDF